MNNLDEPGLVLVGGAAGVTGSRPVLVERTGPSVRCTSCGWVSQTPGSGSAAFAAAWHAGASSLTWRQLLREVVEIPQLWFTREVVHAAATAVTIAEAPLPDPNHDLDWTQHATLMTGALEPLAEGAWYLGALPNGCPHRGNTT